MNAQIRMSTATFFSSLKLKNPHINIAVAKPDASREEITEAAKKASVHDFIMSLPDNYDSKTGFNVYLFYDFFNFKTDGGARRDCLMVGL